LTASSKVHLLCCAASFVIAAYFYVRLFPQDLRALQPVGFADLFKGLRGGWQDLFTVPSYFMTFCKSIKFKRETKNYFLNPTIL